MYSICSNPVMDIRKKELKKPEKHKGLLDDLSLLHLSTVSQSLYWIKLTINLPHISINSLQSVNVLVDVL